MRNLKPPCLILLLLCARMELFGEDVTFSINCDAAAAPVSPYIFGTNALLEGGENWAALRQGGNRLTGYNWENNFSNAGSDWFHSSDNYLVGAAGIQNGTKPGIVVTAFHDRALEMEAYSLVTLQMAGYVARDGKGTVTEAETAPSARWAEVKFEKEAAFSTTPDLKDNFVYMDEFVNFLVDRYGDAQNGGGVRGYAMDNEPALWSFTHPRIHPKPATCAEIVQRTVALARAVKKVDPGAEIFGPALYGFNAYTTFQDAPDWNAVKGRNNYSWFIDYYLDEMKKAETAAGMRLLDVLDVHYYSEAKGDHRITEKDATTAADIAARLQAPRTLWQAGYAENSWIGQYGGANLPLIPKLKASIDRYYPGTKLAFTEISFGGPAHISGALAAADMLGIMAGQGVYFCAFWPTEDKNEYVSAAYKMFRNYDGKGSTFGDRFVDSKTSQVEKTSVYGSIKNTSKGIHIIALNKDLNKSLSARFSIQSARVLVDGSIWVLDKTGPSPRKYGDLTSIQDNAFSTTLPPGSVSHFIIRTAASSGGIGTGRQTPSAIGLKPYPNPFNTSCCIEYALTGGATARMDVVSPSGRVVDSFGPLSGSGKVQWSAGRNGRSGASGVYGLVLRGRDGILASRKILLLK
jgi:mannan endo-1,4-beta-mannosidase